MHNGKTPLASRFIVTPKGEEKGEKISFQAVLSKAMSHLLGGNSAADALHAAYKELTGCSHLAHSGTNARGLPVYKDKEGYEALAATLLPILRQLHRTRKIQAEELQYLAEVVQPEIERGVSVEALRDIGYFF